MKQVRADLNFLDQGNRVYTVMANCPKCGAANPPDKKFCTRCGAGLPGAAPDAPAQKSGIPAPPPVNPFRQAQPPDTALKPHRPKPALQQTPQGQAAAEPDALISGDSPGQATGSGPTHPVSAPAPMDKSALPPMFQPPELEKKSSAPMSPSFAVAPDPDLAADADAPWDGDPGDPDAAARSEPQDLFQRKPWLARLLGFGCVFFFVIPMAIALTVKTLRGPEIASRPAAGADAEKTQRRDAAQACAMIAKISAGDVRVQQRPGTHFIPLPQGGCTGPGAAIMTGAHGRLQLDIRDPRASLFVNGGSSVFLNPAAQGQDRAPSLLRMQQGEIWLSFSGAEDPVRLALPLAVVTATGAGDFHFLARGDQSYVTSATGALQAETPVSTAPLAIGAGQQVIFGGTGQVREQKNIDRAKFLRWVNAWKQGMAQPADKGGPQTAGKPGAATDTAAADPAEENQRIVDTVISSPPAPMPDFVTASVVARSKAWAIAKTVDSRPDGAYNEDYWPQTAVLLKKEDTGHWRALEFFPDYTPDLLQQWGQRYGFNRNHAKALGLE